MSDEEIEALSPDLRALLDREAAAHPDDAALRSQVLARVERAVALHGPSGGDGGGSDGQPTDGSGGAGNATPGPGAGVGLGIAKVVSLKAATAVAIAAFVGGAAVGGSIVSSSRPPESRPSPSPSSAASALPSISSPDVAVDAAPLASASVSSFVATSAPTASSGPRRGLSEPGGDLTRERELLDVARAALGHGDPAGAIAAARRHEESFPRGLLVEEREVVWIQALARSGQSEAAKRKASNFRAAHRNSVLLPVVEAAIRALPEKDAEP